MKREVVVLLLLGILLISPLIRAQEQAQTYSGLGRFIDNVKMFFTSDKVNLALEIREKEIDSAINNIQNQGKDKAIKNLERAKEKLQVVQEKVSLETSEKIKTSVDEIIDKINQEEDLPDEFDDYILEEEKTQLTAELTEKTFEYCEELAKEDFALMLQEEECNPETAPDGLGKELEKLKDLQLRMFVQLMLEIRSCIDDPGTCNCEVNVDAEQKAKCEKMVALAIRCEYKKDETSCNELKAMEPKKGDNFAESFVPDFLMNLFREKSYMVEYDIEHSDGVPEECWDYNDKPECRQYDHLKETKDDWDEYGNFIGKRPKDRELTMRESIPQCFDENDNFLEEKCGEIIVVKSEEGLTNYLIKKEIDNIINDFENKSAQHTIDEVLMVDEIWTVDEGEWTIDGKQVQVGNNVRIIKRDMNQITNQIKGINYAAGTGGGDGQICCKKIINGGTQYRWDTEDVCIDPESVKGEVVAHDFCLALGPSIGDDDEVITDGVPKECAEQGAYDKESCGAIMRELRRILDLERMATGLPSDSDAPDGGLSPEVETDVAGDSGGDSGSNVVDNNVITGDGDGGDVIDSGTVVDDDGSSNDVTGVDDGSGEPRVIDED